jgi:hypothetical protein
LDRLADLVPPPRKHRHRYHGVFAPNHKLRQAVTALAIGNVGKQREAATDGHGGDGHGTAGCYDTTAKPRSHDTSRIAWAKLMARAGEEFPLQCPACGGDIRLIAFITEPGPILKILTTVLLEAEWKVARASTGLKCHLPCYPFQIAIFWRPGRMTLLSEWWTGLGPHSFRILNLPAGLD